MQVGDYVRTEISSLNIQRIGKIEKIISDDYIHTDIGTYDNEYIIKSSPNIIDLIKYGDIVKHKINGEDFISEVWGEENNYFIVVYDRAIDLGELNIVSIVTKEQFEEMEYKI